MSLPASLWPENMPAPSVGVVLLNYGAPKETVTCLRALKNLNYPNFQVWVVDNASPDDSLLVLEAASSDETCQRFHLITAPTNGGYSAGNNLAIKAVLDLDLDYVWLLNNDTEPDPEALHHLVVMAEKTKGLVGSVCRYPDGTYQRVGTRLKWWTGGVSGYAEDRLLDGMSVDNLTGASMLISAAIIRHIGLLPEPYFLYFEDGEYTLRAQRAGYSTVVALHSQVFHKEGATTGRQSILTQYYYHRNRLHMLKAYASPAQQVTILAYAVFRLIRSIMKTIPSTSVEKRASLRVQWLAWCDYLQGVTGPCPHPLQTT